MNVFLSVGAGIVAALIYLALHGICEALLWPLIMRWYRRKHPVKPVPPTIDFRPIASGLDEAIYMDQNHTYYHGGPAFKGGFCVPHSREQDDETSEPK